MDCLDEFKVFQECLKKNPEHVEKIMNDAEEAAQENEIETAEKGDSQPASDLTAGAAQSK